MVLELRSLAIVLVVLFSETWSCSFESSPGRQTGLQLEVSVSSSEFASSLTSGRICGLVVSIPSGGWRVVSGEFLPTHKMLLCHLLISGLGAGVRQRNVVIGELLSMSSCISCVV